MIPLFKVANDRERALKNVSEVLESGYVGQGAWCERLEAFFNTLLAKNCALYLNSGTSALKLAYKLAGVGPGTEVISTPITCIATNSAIVELGADIVWADVDTLTGNLFPDDAVKKITPRTRAIVGVDWAGRRCDFPELRRRTRGITLVEDAAHRMPTIGQGGDFVCHSFQAIKFLNTADGGLLICPSLATYERAKLLRWFGLDRSRSDAMRCYQPIDETGFKMQGNDVLAAIGCANLSVAVVHQERQYENADALYSSLSPLRNVRVPPIDPDCHYWLFTILVSSPPLFEEFMRKQGVAVSQVHARNDLYGAFRQFQRGGLPGVDHFAAHQVSIPVGWWLEPAQLAQVIQAVQSWDGSKEARWNAE